MNKRDDAMDSEFKQMAWRYFDVDAVLTSIVADKQPFPFQREILCQALISWTIFCDKKEIKATIASEIQQIFGAIEKKVKRQNNSKNLMERDFSAKRKQLGPKFYEEIFYPIGGSNCFREVKNNYGQRNKRKKAAKSKEIKNIIKVFEVLHYHSFKLKCEKIYKKPSLNQAYEVMNCLAVAKESRIKSPEQQTDKWAYYTKKQLEPIMSWRNLSSCFLYSSKFVTLQDNQSLFDFFANGSDKLPKNNLKEIVQEWLEYTAFVKSEIVDRMNGNAFEDLTKLKSLRVKPKCIPTPVMEKWELECFDAIKKPHKQI